MAKSSPQRQGEGVFSLLLVVFSTTAFWQSYLISGFTGLSTPGVFPMLASATMFVAALFILMQSFRYTNKSNSDALGSRTTNSEGFLQTILPLRLLMVVLLITAYVIAMPMLGFLLSSGIFLFLSFSYLWRKSLMVSLLITLVSVVSVYLIFRKLFQVVLPKGTLLPGWY